MLLVKYHDCLLTKWEWKQEFSSGIWTKTSTMLALTGRIGQSIPPLSYRKMISLNCLGTVSLSHFCRFGDRRNSVFIYGVALKFVCNWIFQCRKRKHDHWYSLTFAKAYGDQVVDSSTGKQWTLRFSNGDCDARSYVLHPTRTNCQPTKKSGKCGKIVFSSWKLSSYCDLNILCRFHGNK